MSPEDKMDNVEGWSVKDVYFFATHTLNVSLYVRISLTLLTNEAVDEKVLSR